MTAERRQYVYRLWSEDDACLYVGQHTGFHPMTRINQHKSKSWWPEVARFDWDEIPVDHDLNAAETEQIRALKGRYNIVGRGSRHATIVVSLDVEVINELRRLSEETDAPVSRIANRRLRESLLPVLVVSR